MQPDFTVPNSLLFSSRRLHYIEVISFFFFAKFAAFNSVCEMTARQEVLAKSDERVSTLIIQVEECVNSLLRDSRCRKVSK